LHSSKNLHHGRSKSTVPTGHKQKNFSFHFKRYNLTIRAVSFFETFCACSPSSLGKDPTIKIPKKKKICFLLLELEMANLSIFLRKNDLHPLGVKLNDMAWNDLLTQNEKQPSFFNHQKLQKVTKNFLEL
jgi:hypothetical protein